MIYKCKFNGRRIGSVQPIRQCVDYVRATNHATAKQGLYDRYETVMGFRCETVRGK